MSRRIDTRSPMKPFSVGIGEGKPTGRTYSPLGLDRKGVNPLILVFRDAWGEGGRVRRWALQCDFMGLPAVQVVPPPAIPAGLPPLYISHHQVKAECDVNGRTVVCPALFCLMTDYMPDEDKLHALVQEGLLFATGQGAVEG